MSAVSELATAMQRGWNEALEGAILATVERYDIKREDIQGRVRIELDSPRAPTEREARVLVRLEGGEWKLTRVVAMCLAGDSVVCEVREA